MPILFRDFETRSTLHLPDVGAWKYSGHDTTGVWCVAYAVDDDPVQIWTRGQPIPEPFRIAAIDSDWIVVAHNDSFESAIEERRLAPRYNWPLVPIERHRCTMAMALANALPGALDKAAAALGLPVRKDAEGHRLMLAMAKPRKPRPDENPAGTYWHDDPERIRRLQDYCRRDVEMERALFKRLPPLSDAEQALWALDAEINLRGFYVDVPLAEAARKIVRERRAAINQELTELTGGRITSIAQVNRIADYLKEHGHNIAGVGKRSIAAVLAHKPDEDIARLLRLRQEGGKASVSKLDTLFDMVNDERIHGALRFHGAATGRWSGSGFQPHNLARAQPADPEAAIAAVMSGNLTRVAAIGPPLEVIGSLSRSMICAAPGKVLMSADFSAIESRVLAWLAGETWKLETYRQYDATGDPALEPYCATASKILGRAVTPDDEDGRQIGKLCDLAYGFGGGAGAFNRIAADAGFSDTQVEQFKRQWRTAHPAIVRHWGDLHRALLRAVRTGKPVTFKNLTAEMRTGNLHLILPSGRAIVYPEAHIEPGQFDSDQIIFKDSALGKWRDARGWHGVFVENVVQAVSRDLLAMAMQRLDAAGYSIVLHVHDECVAEVPEAFGSPDEFAKLMTELPSWAKGLPLAAKARVSKRYAKEKSNAGHAVGNRERPFDLGISDGHGSHPQVHSPDPERVAVASEVPGASSGGTDNPAESRDELSGDHSGQNHEKDTHQSRDSAAGHSHGDSGPKQGRWVATYIYAHPDRPKYLRVDKYDSHKFYQYHWDGKCWVCKIKGTYAETKIPYRLPELIVAPPAEPVWICEGEKDADNVAALGLIATTNPGGAKQFQPELAQWFKGKTLAYVLEDNDTAGREHTAKILAALTAIVPNIAVVSFPELPEKGDVSDWLALGGNKQLLIARAEQAMKQSGKDRSYIATDLSKVQPRAIRWLWPKHLARGALELLAGAPTVGKSQIQCQYVACATTGHDWPNGAPGIVPCRVIMLTAEDNTDDTLVPRLVAAGADLSRVKQLNAIRRNGKEELFLLGEDLAALEQLIHDWGDVGLVTIDIM
jgi:DNA polymerase